MSTITKSFTKEHLIEHAKKHIAHDMWLKKKFGENHNTPATVELAEIALAVLTAPDYIPPHVLDAMSDMCDGGFNAQGIWDLCRESIMPPAPCTRCGTVSDRPDGGHYCHVNASGE
ncbi:hypothetical protein QCJ66_000951 [Enterobacter ludwigii]|nr:hypothetical protein [Enterobacter ludwigii]